MSYDMSEFAVKVMDWSGEFSGHGGRVALITSANYDAQTTLRDAYIDALEDVINGEIQQHSIRVVKKQDAGRPSDVTSRRETKLRVTYKDTVTFDVDHFDIPTFDITKVTMVEGTDEVSFTAGTGLALKTAIDAYFKSPRGNAIQVIKLTSVGRNL